MGEDAQRSMAVCCESRVAKWSRTLASASFPVFGSLGPAWPFVAVGAGPFWLWAWASSWPSARALARGPAGCGLPSDKEPPS